MLHRQVHLEARKTERLGDTGRKIGRFQSGPERAGFGPVGRPVPSRSREPVRGASLDLRFPFRPACPWKEYTEARKSRRCGEAGRLAQAQVQTTPPRAKAGRSKTKHRPRCWPRLATPFTCLASCPIYPRALPPPRCSCTHDGIY